MTLGLATCDDDGIYLAIESQGLPLGGPLVRHQFPLLLDSKILQLNRQPQVVVLAAGGLEHWAYVAANYSSTLSVHGATLEIVRLLDLCMTEKNQAFGLVCGYENHRPKCYKVDREQGWSQATWKLEPLAQIVTLGMYTKEAKDAALGAIENKVHPLVALAEAIERLFPQNEIRGPVHSLVMRPGN